MIFCASSHCASPMRAGTSTGTHSSLGRRVNLTRSTSVAWALLAFGPVPLCLGDWDDALDETASPALGDLSGVTPSLRASSPTGSLANPLKATATLLSGRNLTLDQWVVLVNYGLQGR